MKILIKFLCFLFSISLTQAQVSQRNFLGNKYSLLNVKEYLITKNEWKPYPKTTEEWKIFVPDSILQNIVKEGEKALNYRFEAISGTMSLDFTRSGDREKHEKISMGKRKALTQLVLAESIDDKNRFTDAILNGIWSICEESYWGVPAHISKTGLPDVETPIVDLFSAETASTIALADYFVGEKLDKINVLIRKRMYYETNHRIFEQLLNNSDKYGWMSKTKPVNNWNPWIMSNWILSNLLLEKNEDRRAEMLHFAMLGLDLYLNGLGEDGGCDEGPSYWFVAGGSVFDCLDLLQNATQDKVNIYDKLLIHKMASYVYKVHIDNDYFVNFADADPKLKPNGLMLIRLGKALKDDKISEFGKWAYQSFPNNDVSGTLLMRKLANVLEIKKIDAKPNTYKPVNEAWISDIQVLTARSKKGLFLATHGGHNDESHNHNDVGDFIIYQNGQPILVDAGRGDYTARTFSNQRYELWFTQSQYHNLPIINGFGQKAGRQFGAKNVTSNMNEKELGLTMDIASAYPKEAGIDAWKRIVKLNRNDNQVEVLDEYNFKEKPKSIQQIFMTICEIDSTQSGKIRLKGEKNANMTLNYDASIWTLSTENPSTDGMEYKSFKTKWNNRIITRIILTNKKLEKNGNYKIVFDGK